MRSSAAGGAGGVAASTAPASSGTGTGSKLFGAGFSLGSFALPIPTKLPTTKRTKSSSSTGTKGKGSSSSSSAGASRADQRFMSGLKLTGHSGPVSAVDAYELRPPAAAAEKKGTLFSGFGGGGKGKGTKDSTTATDEPPKPRTLPFTSKYVVVSGGTDGTVRAWTATWTVDKRGRPSGEAQHLSTHSSLHKSGAIIEQVKLSADGCKVVSVGRDGSMGIVDIPTGKTWAMTSPPPPSTSRGLFSWGASSAAPVDPVTSPSGLPLVTCSIDVTRGPMVVTSAGADGTARVWDLRTGSVSVAFPSGSPVWAFSTIPAHGGGAPQLDAEGNLTAPSAPLGDRYLVSGHEDGLVRVWDSRKAAAPMATWSCNGSPVTALKARGDKVVTGCADGVVRLWDARSGLPIRCDGHTGQVIGTGVHDDYMLSASWDGTLRVFWPST